MFGVSFFFFFLNILIKVSYIHQLYIILITNIVKTVILLNIISLK